MDGELKRFNMRKIITISYTADFARFFEKILSNVSPEVEFFNFSIHLSSYLYSKVHGIQSCYLPLSVRSYEKNDIEISEDSLKKIVSYHTASGCDPKIINEIALKYLNFYTEFFKRTKVDFVILSGDTRLQVKTLEYVAKKHNIGVLYFEQGPLNTTILDEKGVNANCSFRQDGKTISDDKELKKAKLIKPKKWNGYKKYRFLDFVFENLFFEKFKELNVIKINHLNQRNKNNKTSNVQDCYCLLVLQVPEDVNMLCHSPFFSNHLDIVKSVYEALPNDISLVIREHPLYAGRYEDELYVYANKNQISFDKSVSLNESISKSSFVVVNNSTVGVESIVLGKPIVVLGNSYYDDPKFVFKFNGNNLIELMSLANSMPNIPLNTSYRINYLFKECFISGHFRDADVKRFNGISSVLSSIIYNKKRK